MITRPHSILRVAAFLLLALALWGMPSGAKAQKCACDHYTFIVNSDVGCKVQIAWALSPDGKLFTETLGPGDRYKVPCPLYEAYIVTCNGQYKVLPIDPAGRVCSRILTLSTNCCVQACYGVDREGCPTITIRRADCAVDEC